MEQNQAGDNQQESRGVFSVSMMTGLSFRQAVATLLIALVLGLSASAYEMVQDYQHSHDRARQDHDARMRLVQGLAIQASYQLSRDLSEDVTSGLMLDPAVSMARISDNYGAVLSQAQRPLVVTALPGLAERLFGDIAFYSLDLFLPGSTIGSASLGVLEMRLDPGVLLNQWLGRVWSNVWGRVAGAVILSLLVVAVFYAMITKPLLRITRAISQVDPASPGAQLIPAPQHHQRDELGLLVANTNRLLQQSQAGLDGRDKAQAELAALARELEQRVAERTAELAQEKAGVERALEQLNVVNQQLEQANRFVSDGIRYASRIQTALLPEPGSLGGMVQDLAVGWQPLDIVGGDYYWTGQYEGKAVIALMDCTGHGVPGAFMTAVVASGFSRILQHHDHSNPALMLQLLNRLVRSALRQDRHSAVSNDGLDAAICVLDPAARTLTFAGANLPLLLTEGGEWRFVRGDRMSIGYQDSSEEYQFTNVTIPLQPDSTFYLYTDGMTDQVGGPNRRLFGRERLQQTLQAVQQCSLGEQLDHLFQVLGQWRQQEKRRDDMTFLAFRPQGE